MNYYELLGVSQNASPEDIKAAYKKQMKKWHPDINKDEKAESMSIKINEAKDTLLNEEKRREYDLFLKQKESEVYKKYSNVKYKTKESVYESHMVTKWEYFKEYLNNKNISNLKKAISIVLVSLETFLCFILKWIVIGLALLSFTLSDVIFMAFYYMLPIIGLLLVFVIFKFVTVGYSNLINNNFEQVRGLIVFLVVYLSSYLFIFIGKKLISEKVFNFLYNKLDIYLFKKSVFYGQN